MYEAFAALFKKVCEVVYEALLLSLNIIWSRVWNIVQYAERMWDEIYEALLNLLFYYYYFLTESGKSCMKQQWTFLKNIGAWHM